MKRSFLLLFLLVPFLLIPTALFAQTPQSRDMQFLKRLGLSDAQAAQVMDVQRKAEATVRQDTVQLRLLRAQIDKALLPSSVDMQAVNSLIDQASVARADMQKALVAARVQMRQLMGDDAARTYFRHIRWELRHGFVGRETVRAHRFFDRLFEGRPSGDWI